MSEVLHENDLDSNPLSIISTLQSDDVESEVTKGKFKVELNLGLALPCVFRPSAEYDLTKENKSVVKFVKDDGSIVVLGVSTQSNNGPLGAFDNDVLTVLLTLAWEQREGNQHVEKSNGYRVYYTLAEICRRLGISENTSYSVSKSIEKIKSQNLNLKNFIYSSKTKQTAMAKENTRLILKSGETVIGRSDSDFTQYNKSFWIEFDSYIMKNMQDDFISLVHEKDYLSLKSGPQRRTLVFLNSKRRGFGDQFVFNLAELAAILGIHESPSKRKLIDRYLKQLKSKMGTFEYKIDKVKGKQMWNILICFTRKDLALEGHKDNFFLELEKFYSEESMESLGIEEIDVLNYKREFSSQYERTHGIRKINLLQEEVCPAELAIDLTLFQVLVNDYKITKTFKALLKAVFNNVNMGSFELPDGYRYFVTTRNKEKRKKHLQMTIKQEVLKREERVKKEARDFEKSFDLFFNDVLQNNKTYMKKLEARASERLADDSNNPVFGLLLQSEMQNIAKEDFLNGDILDDKDIGRMSRKVEFVRD